MHRTFRRKGGGKDTTNQPPSDRLGRAKRYCSPRREERTITARGVYRHARVCSVTGRPCRGTWDPAEIPGRLLEAFAMEGYRSQRLSHNQVGRLLGLDYWQTEDLLTRHDAAAHNWPTCKKIGRRWRSLKPSDCGCRHRPNQLPCGRRSDCGSSRSYGRVVLASSVVAELTNRVCWRLSVDGR